jgi:hypothetical protein
MRTLQPHAASTAPGPTAPPDRAAVSKRRQRQFAVKTGRNGGTAGAGAPVRGWLARAQAAAGPQSASVVVPFGGAAIPIRPTTRDHHRF